MTPEKITDWTPIDRIEMFRLGQWAAIICGYVYPKDINDDPGLRPWADEFFYIKRAIQVGKFKLDSGATKINRTTEVSRAEMRRFYDSECRFEPAVFPELRENPK